MKQGKREKGKGKREEGKGKREEGKGKREKGKGKGIIIFIVVLLFSCSIVAQTAQSPPKETQITKEDSIKPDSTEFKFWVAEWEASIRTLRLTDSIAIYNRGYWEGIRNERFMRARNAEIKLKQSEVRSEKK